MYRLLLVDDDVPFVESLLNVNWQTLNCVCAGTAYNGTDALRRMEEIHPDIVISDINMPGMDGILLMEEMRTRHPHVQMILLTVLQDFMLAQRAIRGNAVDYVLKDMTYRQQLLRAVEKAVHRLESLGESEWKPAADFVLHLNRYENSTLEKDMLEAYLSARSGILLCFSLGKDADMHKIEEAQRTWRKRIPALRGIVLPGEGRIEWIVEGTQKKTLEMCEQMMVQKGALFNVPSEHFLVAVGGMIRSAEEYRREHARCIDAFHAFFFDGGSVVRRAEAQAFAEPTGLDLRRWAAWAEDAMHACCEEQKASLRRNMETEWRRMRYRPDMLVNAALRLYQGAALRYGDEQNQRHVANITCAITLNALMDALCRALMSLSNQKSYFVRMAIGLMKARMDDSELQLADIAQEVGISPGYLSVKLKEEMGKSFQEMLIALRMERAQELLHTSSDKVYQIAEKCGYSNARAFTNAYTRYFGHSPKKN